MNGASADSTATMPMRPIAKWRGRDQDRHAGDFQSARVGKPGGCFARPDRPCFVRVALARMVLSRLPRGRGWPPFAGRIPAPARPPFCRSKSKRGAARARQEISIFTFLRSPGLRAFARHPRARGRVASAILGPISVSSCMGCGHSMSMAIRRTAAPPQGFHRASPSKARKDFTLAKGLPGMNG